MKRHFPINLKHDHSEKAVETWSTRSKITRYISIMSDSLFLPCVNKLATSLSGMATMWK
jgi:hypothetical protein